MQLNETAKNELRKLIEERVAQVPDGERIHLDKDLLDSLLFYKLYLQKSKETIKIPIWSGDFLSKIDLSEISFDNVWWDANGEYVEDYLLYDGEITKLEADCILKYMQPYPSSYLRVRPIYRYTNANIKFSQKCLDNINFSCVFYCDFEGTDLSNNLLKDFSMWGCNLKNTNISLESLNEEYFYTGNASNNYSGMNFNKLTVYLDDLYKQESDLVESYSNFSNTGISVSFAEDSNISLECQKEVLDTMVSRGLLNGCYLDGKLIQNNILPPKNAKEAEQRANKEQILQQYEAYKKGIFDEVLGGIDEQTSSMKK